MLWKRIQRRIVAATGPSPWPVPAGLAMGAAILIVVSLAQATPSDRRVADSGDSGDSVSRFNGLQEQPTPTQVPRNAGAGLLLPPRTAATDITRRIENGLPLRENPPVTETVAETSLDPETNSGRPQIALVIDDMGFDRVNSSRAVRLPPEVTLAYLPFAPGAAAQVRAARLKGHPVMLHLPMEAPNHKGNPGFNVLAVADDETALRRRLTRILGRFGGYTGVNNHMGSRFTRDRAKMDIVLSELKKRGLFFLDSRTSGRSVAAESAKAIGIPYAVRDVFIDHDPMPSTIREQLAKTERIARKTGQAIAIGHPRKSTIDVLTPWLQDLASRGFDLVRVDTLLKRSGRKALARAQSGE